ncbi:MAG: radical SAM protein [Candidatus Brocadiales bacterium]
MSTITETEASSVILLEHPRPDDPDRHQDVVNAPLSANLQTPYISAVLKSQKIPVELIDANLMRWSMQRTLGEIAKRRPRLLGVHMVYLWGKTADVFDLLSRIHDCCPNTHINLYGFYPTFSYEDICKQFTFIDSVTIGEPETSFFELAQSLLRNRKNTGLSAIDGLAFAVKNSDPSPNIVKTRQRTLLTDLDSLPFPDRSHMHQNAEAEHGLATYILASRGCYNHCTFCYINPSYASGLDSSWRGRSAGSVFGEIRSLYDDSGIRYLYFADANFFGPGRAGKERTSRLADLIIKDKLKIRFGIECRANDIEEHSLSRLVNAGLREVFLGIESGCQKTLDRFKKGLSKEVNECAVRTLRRFGIEPTLGFIMFHPDSTLADIRENFEFLRKLELLRTPAVTAHILHHRQTFFRGTPDFRYTLEKSTARLEPLNGYEAFCEYSDPGVTEFAKIATSLCRSVLAMLHPDEADVCNTAIANGPSVMINQSLIRGYDRLLTAFEAANQGAPMPDPQDVRHIHDDTLRQIAEFSYKTTGQMA